MSALFGHPAVVGALVAATSSKSSSSSALPLLILVAVVAGGYFLFLRPQQQRQRQQRAQRSEVVPGDEVLTVGGIVGRVVHVEGDRVTIVSGEEVDGAAVDGTTSTRLVLVKQGIARKIEPTVTNDDEDEYDSDEYDSDEYDSDGYESEEYESNDADDEDADAEDDHLNGAVVEDDHLNGAVVEDDHLNGTGAAEVQDDIDAGGRGAKRARRNRRGGDELDSGNDDPSSSKGTRGP
jgi:preprotein translocase subunit YajC